AATATEPGPPAVAAAPPPDPPADPCAGFDRAVAGTAGDAVAPFLALRRAPDETAGKIAELPDGTRVRVLGGHGRWRRVAVCRGAVGWVHGRWLAPAGGGP
ncbi:MAG: SH3 domain-containing protein, partial [Deltaproteobacteria bacterium]|nr:SH3 domain-containing protein [Deltaproteobacteria bacterium]